MRQDIPMPIIVNSQNTLQFYVELACPRPGYLPDPYVTCYATSLEEFGFEDDPTGTDLERQESLYYWLMERLLTFHIHKRGAYYTATDVTVYDLGDKAEFWEYEPVPVLTSRMAVGSLADALAAGTPLRGLVLPERSPDLPLVAVADGYFCGPFEKVLVSGASVGLKAGAGGLGRLPAVADGVEIIGDDGIWFVERVRFRHLLQELKAAAAAELVAEASIRSVAAPVAPADVSAVAAGTPAGISVASTGAAGSPVDAPGALAGASGVSAGAAGTTAGSGETHAGATGTTVDAAGAPTGTVWTAAGAAGAPVDAAGVPTGAVGTPAGAEGAPTGAAWTPAATAGSPNAPAGTSATTAGVPAAMHVPAARTVRPSAPELTEEQFLQRLVAHARGEGLYFREEELISFHTALKTGSLVVLSGLSGTGKSRMIEVYRQALGLSERSHFLWLSVRPNWNDDADLIGYYDPLNRLYRPGEVGLVDLLLNAQRHPHELFMVCLDEMNLARVEHYFSQFLSNMERPAGQRQIRLYAPELQSEVYNFQRYPAFVPIGRNVLFCGTINVDESTHSFSDKVLDRSAVIRMEHVDLERWWQELCQREVEQEGGAAEEESAPAPVQAMVTATAWEAWRRPFDPSPYGREIALLQGLNALLREVGADRQFGYRVARQILLYLHQVPRRSDGSPFIAPADALDQQVCQRILTKVRGTGAELRDLFRPGGKLEAYLTTSDLSPFPRSLAEIRRKYTELERHDFTS